MNSVLDWFKLVSESYIYIYSMCVLCCRFPTKISGYLTYKLMQTIAPKWWVTTLQTLETLMAQRTRE